MMAAGAIEVAHAYRFCEQVTRREAANFYYGIRLLPAPKRHAMSAVYAFARRVDDIGDAGDLDAATRRARLAGQRVAVDAAVAGRPDADDPVAVALAHAHACYRLPPDALAGLVDGVEMDIVDTRYQTFDQLVGYCRAVAGTIGRLCLAIFTGGAESAGGRGAVLADDLGVALQLTNILRDVCEDRARGRVYLPAEELRGIGGDLFSAPPAEAAGVIAAQAERAAVWFDRGSALAELLDPRSAACLLAMTGIYRRILDRICVDPAAVLRGRLSLPPWEKAWVAARSLQHALGSRTTATPRPTTGAAT